MLEVIITYVDNEMPVETLSILTYIRGEGYWQFLTHEGTTINIPDHAVMKIEILPVGNGESA